MNRNTTMSTWLWWMIRLMATTLSALAVLIAKTLATRVRALLILLSISSELKCGSHVSPC